MNQDWRHKFKIGVNISYSHQSAPMSIKIGLIDSVLMDNLAFKDLEQAMLLVCEKFVVVR